ncbi:5,10-methylenetetrahydrofolate reductase [Candidatus Aerophobetes bacterium]|uniref:Methylenetetrahydrofolate reductase n=1 Tax=Aerophobetes bacterium TaxID=2030807 RepID=A0A662DLX6_UNCAE|nr:MAG: 5,10-methylenetetrahydrofolate reductase [Candidatus Aerophobetes bacterium]
MKLTELFNKGKFVVTSEIGPPKGTNIEPVLKEAEELKGKVDAINVTDLQSSVMRLGSLAVCKLLKERGLEPVFQLTCRDRNRLALQSDLLSAYVLGVENVLCLTGDHNVLGDDPESKPVFDLDSVNLIRAAKTLMEGKDLVGNKLDGSPDFCLGAVANPGADPLEPQIIKMELKAEAGAQFFQTQAVYDVKKFEEFIRKVEHIKVPVMVGIVLLKSAGMAKFMNANVSGVFVPDNLIKIMAAAPKEERPKKSIQIAASLIKELKGMCQGVHLMPLGWDRYVPDVLEKSGLI